jgi:D-amino-acid dehydrogenase
MTQHIAVIGAGIVGAATALQLVREGHRVTIIEPETPGGEQAASYGNGAWISPASIIPMSMPGLWKKVPGYLLDQTGPLTIRWASLPGLLPWLMRFLAAGASVLKVTRTAAILHGLIGDAPERHQALADFAGCSALIRRDGLVYAYPDRAAFEAEALSWRLRRENGLIWQELDGAALRALLHALSPHYGFGILVPAGSHCLDPGAYVAALVAKAEVLGTSLMRARATGFRIEGGRLAAVTTDQGDVPCTRAVIAAGIRSAVLAQAAGDSIPLASERGYHVVIPDPAAAPAIPVMPSDGKMANTLTSTGLRAAGQVELASPDAPPDWRRADILFAHLKRAYPALANTPSPSARWMGHRPSTPDGLPVIGRARATPDVLYALGHGHIGLATAPATADLVTAMIAGRTPHLDCTPFSPERF